MTSTEDVDFGFARVRASEKRGLVQDVFGSVANNYDLMNDLMSGGVHRLWKDALITMLRPTSEMQLLDVAGGTGDIAFRFLKAGGRSVAVCDLTEAMVRVGRDRAIDQGLVTGSLKDDAKGPPLNWIVGDAQNLPVPDSSMDAYTIAFGLRNVTDIDKALREARRVLRPGGRFLCLEFSTVILPLFDKLYDLYSFNILPVLGGVVARDRDSYQYLVESIRRFPPQKTLAEKMQAAGFEQVSWQNLTGGVAAIHSAWRI